MLTDAGGQPRATDPRFVRLQEALKSAPGVQSIAPPRVNKTGTAAVFAIQATTRPADPKTADLVRRLRETVVPQATRGQGVTAYVGGVTAAYEDLSAMISSRLPLVIGVVLALSFVVLLAAFRSVLVPLKAILCNLLAVGAAFGVLTAFFQWGWGLPLIGLQNPYGTVAIASYVPLIMFAVLFGMSTDYEVFLISQIFHAHAEGMDTHAAVRAGRRRQRPGHHRRGDHHGDGVPELRRQPGPDPQGVRHRPLGGHPAGRDDRAPGHRAGDHGAARRVELVAAALAAVAAQGGPAGRAGRRRCARRPAAPAGPRARSGRGARSGR